MLRPISQLSALSVSLSLSPSSLSLSVSLALCCSCLYHTESKRRHRTHDVGYDEVQFRLDPEHTTGIPCCYTFVHCYHRPTLRQLYQHNIRAIDSRTAASAAKM